MTFRVISKSPEFTTSIGEKIGKQLSGKEIIFLSGDLGAGKTLLTKGMAKALGIDQSEIVSPTFTLMNQYYGKFKLFHYDLYRLAEVKLESMPEIDDYIGEAVLAIEWAQYLPESYFKLKNSLNVELNVMENDSREIVISTSITGIYESLSKI